MRISSSRPSRHKIERFMEAERQWNAMPFEGKIAMVVIPVGLLVFMHLIHLLPIVQQAASLEELSAAGTLIGLFAALLILRTFGAVTDQSLEAQRQAKVRVQAQLAGTDGGVMSGGGMVVRPEPTTIEQLAALNQHDPGFSEPKLGEFSRALLLRAAAARTPEAQTALLPYVSRAAMADLRAMLDGAEQVLPGPVRVRAVEEAAVWTTLEVAQPFLAAKGGRIQRADLVWTLRRTSAARSPSPVDMLRFACPACGAPVEVTHPDGHCTTCDTGITHGQLCWQVTVVEGRLGAPMWPEARQGGGEHPSLLPRTVEDFAIDAAMRGLQARHPEITLSELEKRAAMAAAAWFEAMIVGDPAKAAALLSEGLAGGLRYEIGRLKAGRLALTGGPVQVDQVEWSRVGQDGWNELADLRVYLTLPWCVRDPEGNTVDGDPELPREQSVYVRLFHPAGAAHSLEGWKLWQVLDPRELFR